MTQPMNPEKLAELAERESRSRIKRLIAAWRKPRRSSERCPWCRLREGGIFRVWSRDPFLDCYTCSHCGGTSLWRWEMCMIFIGSLDPPKPAWPPVEFYDIETASLRSLSGKRSSDPRKE